MPTAGPAGRSTPTSSARAWSASRAPTASSSTPARPRTRRLQEQELGTFYLTDFLARQFESIIVAGLGLDRHPELRDDYFGSYRRLVYLAQTDDDDLTARARAAADRLGLAFERRATGFGELTPRSPPPSPRPDRDPASTSVAAGA